MRSYRAVDKIVPVDVYIPGCPPRLMDVMNALMILRERSKLCDDRATITSFI